MKDNSRYLTILVALALAVWLGISTTRTIENAGTALIYELQIATAETCIGVGRYVWVTENQAFDTCSGRTYLAMGSGAWELVGEAIPDVPATGDEIRTWDLITANTEQSRVAGFPPGYVPFDAPLASYEAWKTPATEARRLEDLQAAQGLLDSGAWDSLIASLADTAKR